MLDELFGHGKRLQDNCALLANRSRQILTVVSSLSMVEKYKVPFCVAWLELILCAQRPSQHGVRCRIGGIILNITTECVIRLMQYPSLAPLFMQHTTSRASRNSER